MSGSRPVGIKRFTPAAREALTQSHAEAVKSEQEKITDLHLLIALVKDTGRVGKMLSNQGVDLEDIRKLGAPVMPSPKRGRKAGKVELDTSIQRVLEQATEVARQRNSPAIGTGHLLFALIKNPSSRLKTVLDASGLDRSRILERLEPMLELSQADAEFTGLLETLEACRRQFPENLTVQNRLDRIEEILREHFGEDEQSTGE
jgi:ATP-dependent Clp protease ATP-binding subunit ClpC